MIDWYVVLVIAGALAGYLCVASYAILAPFQKSWAGVSIMCMFVSLTALFHTAALDMLVEESPLLAGTRTVFAVLLVLSMAATGIGIIRGQITGRKTRNTATIERINK